VGERCRPPRTPPTLISGTQDGMDARTLRLALTFVAWLFAAQIASAAQWKTDNFVVYAPTEEFAKRVAMTAEAWRKRLAKEWLGYELPNWYKPCPIHVKVGQIGAGGATTFHFDVDRRTGEPQVFGWHMTVQGTAERILDSVIPHEVSHTVFASHFRRPLPRWADEGAATLAEHESEQRRQDLHLKQVWNSGKIPLKTLLQMTEYPSDMRDVMTLYAQGYSLAGYLVQKGGRRRYLVFLDDAEKLGWEAALRKHYKIEGVEALERTWGGWVIAGSPPLTPDQQLADAGQATGRETNEVIRAQNPDAEEASPRATPPVRTASAEPEFEGFLPPQPGGRRTAAAGAEDAAAAGKAPRPAPLGGFSSRDEGRRSRAATETSDRQPSAGRRSLPRTSRAEPTAASQGRFDFFETAGADESTGAPRRVLGAGDFPGMASR
jgi:hypothetical protein